MKPLRAAWSNVDLTKITPWAGVSIFGSVASDILTPLASIPGWVFLFCVVCAGISFLIVARSNATDVTVAPLRIYGNGILVATILGLCFGGMWIWEITLGNPPGGAIVTRAPELAPLQQSMMEVVKELRAIHEITASTSNNVERLAKDLKQETSADPRKELFNLGTQWTTENFLQAIENGEHRTIELFIEGGMRPDARTDQPVLFYAIARGAHDLEWTLRRFIEAGLDINRPLDDLHESFSPYPLYPTDKWKTPVYIAAVHGQPEALRTLARLGASTKDMEREFKDLIARIDANEAERVHMLDPDYCQGKIIQEKSTKQLNDLAHIFCAADDGACAEIDNPSLGYHRTAMFVCQHMNPSDPRFSSIDTSKANASNRKIYADALGALGIFAPAQKIR